MPGCTALLIGYRGVVVVYYETSVKLLEAGADMPEAVTKCQRIIKEHRARCMEPAHLLLRVEGQVWGSCKLHVDDLMGNSKPLHKLHDDWCF